MLRDSTKGNMDDPSAVLFKDPYVKIFRSDPVVYELPIRTNTRVLQHCESVCCTGVMIPCMFIFQVILCSPCAVCCMCSDVKKGASANHLILREHSLVYRMDPVTVATIDPMVPMLEICKACESEQFYEIELVIPLDDDIRMEILSPVYSCNGNYPFQTLLVKWKGFFIAAIDTPGHAAKFIEMVKTQTAAISDKNFTAQIPQDVQESHEQVIALLGSSQGSEMSTLAHMHAKQRERMMQMQRERQMQPAQQDQQQQLQQPVPQAQFAPPVAEMVRESTRNILDMTVLDVLDVLKVLGLGQYVSSFEKNGIDGGMLLVMDDSTLVELGIQSGIDRKRVLAYVAKHRAD